MERYLPLIIIWITVPITILAFLWFAGFRKYLNHYRKMFFTIESKPIYFSTVFFVSLILIVSNIVCQYYMVELGAYFLNINRGVENWLHTTRGTVDMINNDYQSIFDIPMAATNLLIRPTIAFFGLFLYYYMLQFVLAKISYSNPSLLQRKNLTHWYFTGVFIQIFINILFQAQTKIVLQNSIILFSESLAYVFFGILILCYSRRTEIFELLRRKGIAINRYEQFGFARLWVLYITSLIFYNLLMLPKNVSLPFLPSKIIAYIIFIIFLLAISYLLRRFVFKNYLRYLVDSIASDEDGIPIKTRLYLIKSPIIYLFLSIFFLLVAVNPNWHIAFWTSLLFVVGICLIWIGLLIIATLESIYISSKYTKEKARLPFLYFKKNLRTITSYILIGMSPAILILLLAFSFYTFKPLSSSFYNAIVSQAIIDSNDNLIALKTQPKNTPAVEHQGTDFLQRLIVAQEDQNFYERNGRGFSYDQMSGINFTFLKGSNLCSQIVKNLSFPDSNFPISFLRKIVEVSPSYVLNQKYDTEELLTIYTTIAGFAGGKGDRGIFLASQRIFGKSISHLNELEQLFLVRTLPSVGGLWADGKFIPTSEFSYNPNSLKKMLLELAPTYVERGFVTKRELRKMSRQQISFSNNQKKNNGSLSFSPEISRGTREMFSTKLSLDTFNIKTQITSISEPNLFAANRADSLFRMKMKNYLTKGEYKLVNLAIAVDIKTGKVISHFGANGVPSDYTSNKFTFEAGSPMKPVFLALALNNGLNPNDLLYDGPVKGRFQPSNYGTYSYKYLTVPTCVEDSPNIPFANMMNVNYPSTIKAFDRVLGEIKAESGPHDINLVLGYNSISLNQMATLYQALLNGGRSKRLTFCGDTVPSEKELFKKANAEQVKKWMQGTIERGTASHLKHILPKGTYYSKTGTSSSFLRGWTVLATDDILVVSLVTYMNPNDAKNPFLNTPPIPGESGGRSAGYMATYLMNELLKIKRQ